jgi:hypothetical protein
LGFISRAVLITYSGPAARTLLLNFSGIPLTMMCAP